MKFPFIIAIAVFGAFSFMVMLHVKSDVQTLVSERKILAKEQRQLREDIRVLNTEFAHLTRPDRLRLFASKMGLEEISPYQIVRGEQIHGELPVSLVSLNVE